MKPYPMIRRSGSVAHFRESAAFGTLNIPTSRQYASGFDEGSSIASVHGSRVTVIHAATDCGVVRSLNDRSQNHDHFSFGLVGVHHPVRLADVLEPEYAGWLRLVAAFLHVGGDCLQRDIRHWKARLSKDKTGEEGQVNATCHL